jgi:hypothetical protein
MSSMLVELGDGVELARLGADGVKEEFRVGLGVAPVQQPAVARHDPLDATGVDALCSSSQRQESIAVLPAPMMT